MRATINASPLIFLAKLDRISLLNEVLFCIKNFKLVY